MEVQVLFRPLKFLIGVTSPNGESYFSFEKYAAVIQLARMPPCQGGCRGFESHPPLLSFLGGTFRI